MKLCDVCGGLIADNEQSFAGTPCSCIGDSTLEFMGKERLTQPVQVIFSQHEKDLTAALRECMTALAKSQELLRHEAKKWDEFSKTTEEHGLENWQWECIKLNDLALTHARKLLKIA